MQELIKRPITPPPDIPEKLHQWILVGKVRLRDQIAKIKLIDKLNMARDAKQAALADTQDIAEILLDSEIKLGKMLEKIPDKPASSAKGTRSLPEGIDKKDSHYAQEMARHEDVVEEVKEIAREQGEIATRADVIAQIHRKRERQQPIQEVLTEEFESAFKLLDEVIRHCLHLKWRNISKASVLSKLNGLIIIVEGKND